MPAPCRALLGGRAATAAATPSPAPQTARLSNGLLVRCVSKRDVAFLDQEIYQRHGSGGCVYLRHGIQLPPGGVVLDVGANIGLFSLRAAQELGPGVRRLLPCLSLSLLFVSRPPGCGCALGSVAAAGCLPSPDSACAGPRGRSCRRTPFSSAFLEMLRAHTSSLTSRCHPRSLCRAWSSPVSPCLPPLTAWHTTWPPTGAGGGGSGKARPRAATRGPPPSLRSTWVWAAGSSPAPPSPSTRAPRAGAACGRRRGMWKPTWEPFWTRH